ncbi:MAG: FecR domain-containing protein [Daejeonella sp.]|uniref:FecR family protein n=1 Tax=Daejeonella sp. TaxID=2805397 RepID=UPI0027344E04|nr:FecR family protein [Daejeonella sp.]MDP3469021.1 FecR domain-containing protein [Daejeonella sp.]
MNKKDFQKLLDKYIAGEASLEEEQRLLNFYGSFQNQSEIDQEIDHVGDNIFEKIQESIHPVEEDQYSYRFYYLKSISIAAMILLAITTGLYFYSNREIAEPESFAEIDVRNDIAPGYNKAILTLADGSKISLDDAANGLLASQGNIAITKTENGQIVYENNTIDRTKFMSTRSVINTIQTPKGGKFQVRLPDGSRVWLNSASTLSYPTTFAGNERKVQLKGEAYFEISPNKNIPFRVQSGNQMVEVLGTHFNINSYDDEDYVKTTLLEGSVKVILNSNPNVVANTRLLKPGEQSLTKSTQSAIRIKSADTEKAVAWKNGYFKFKNTPIMEIMREIERWYDVELVYEGKMPNDEFTGFISNDVKISAVLKIMEESGGVKFTVKGKKLKVKSMP